MPLAQAGAAASPSARWTSLPSMPVGLEFFGLGTLSGGGLIAATGYGQAGTNADYATYSPSSHSWTEQGSVPDPENSVAGATAANGNLYVIGGAPDQLRVYNSKTGAWALGPKPRSQGANMSVVGLADGRILVIGGPQHSGTTPDEVDAFSPAIGKWSTLAPIPVEKSLRCGDMAAAASPAGLVYVEGGTCVGGISNQLYIFNTKTNKWSKGPAMPGTRVFYAAAAVGANGYFYVIGGEARHLAVSAQVMAFDPATSKWTARASLPVPTMRGEAVSLRSGTIIYAGGATPTNNFSSAVWELSTT
jgi:N-acetylneuraminic acid mutarotase